MRGQECVVVELRRVAKKCQKVHSSEVRHSTGFDREGFHSGRTRVLSVVLLLAGLCVPRDVDAAYQFGVSDRRSRLAERRAPAAVVPSELPDPQIERLVNALVYLRANPTAPRCGALRTDVTKHLATRSIGDIATGSWKASRLSAEFRCPLGQDLQVTVVDVERGLAVVVSCPVHSKLAPRNRCFLPRRLPRAQRQLVPDR